MVRVEVESLMHAPERDVITALDRRAAAAGLRTASLDEVLCIAEF